MPENNRFPIWISDKNLNPVFWNRAMREQFGVSSDSVRSGFGFGDLSDKALLSVLPSERVHMANWRLRFADGEFRQSLSYFRPIWFRDECFGFVGSTVPYNSDVNVPKPMRRDLPDTPKISIDLCGVVVNAVSAALRSFGPMMSILTHDDCRDIGETRAEYTRIVTRESSLGRPLRFCEEFFRGMQSYPDFNLKLVSGLHEEEAIRVVYLTKPCFTDDGRHIDTAPMQIRFCAEGCGALMYDIDSREVPPIEKILSNASDVHLDDDPEDWAEALFHGVPAFLMTRPWNDWIRTRLRVHSVETMLRACGVETERCYSEYDSRIMNIR